MKIVLCTLAIISTAAAQTGASDPVANLTDVKRVYVSNLGSGAQATALRELIIASLDSTKLFVLTDNPARADATLKGAADDKAFTDSFDYYEGDSSHQNVGKTSSIASIGARATGIYAGGAVSENESHHTRERKHEAYATVRLVNKDGDVLWSTTQESLGAKFRGASADVAAKIAKQLTTDYERARRASETASTPTTQPTKP